MKLPDAHSQKYFALPAALLAVLCLFATLAASSPAAENEALAAATKSIESAQLKRHVEVLADDTFEGREAGSRGGRAASTYLGKEFEKLKLKPLGDDQWFQNFEGSSRNILGLLEGSDPTLKSEVIVIGAHYDHVGYGSPSNSYGPVGRIHNGADDNASGVSGLLEIAEAFRSLRVPPARSVLFAFWDGEEKGLNGSRYWLAHPTVKQEQVKFAVNLDMIGRMREKKGLEVYGTRTIAGSRQLISTANRETNLPLAFTWAMKEDSDHWSFFARQIPVVMFHTGLHDEYHRPSDDANLVNYDGMEQVSRVIFLFTHEMANRREGLAFRKSSQREGDGNRTLFERALGPPSPRFGVTWHHDEQKGTFVVTQITAGSTAEKGGLRVGDEILSFGGWKVDDERRLRLELLYATSPATFQVQRSGAADPLSLSVEAAGTPIRLGLRWREDEAEPGVLYVTQVIPNSSAAMAGVAVSDRIYQLSGERFADSADFTARSQQLETEMTVTLERNGRSREVKMQVLPVRK